MCIAVPMQIIEIDSSRRKARARYKGNEIEIDTRLVSPQKGGYVLVHAGCAIETIRECEAREAQDLLDEIQRMARDED